ncbi:MAG: hypothetical protein CVT59_02330 [Actinobacteria bacterium HGW-Actinobacteria-1]|jgi:hypothetical protein|nr:MAG: hypothetical protein CVT59_02330 [Actinobacteria bacterium HGW-Actinobacteria-1]
MELKRIAEGLTVIAIGLIFLGNTFGVIPWGVWWNVFTLWPLLLIAAGIDVIGRGTDNTWLRVLSSLLVIAGLAWGVFAMPVNGGNWSPFGPFVVTPMSRSANAEPFDNTTQHDSAVLTGTAQINGGVGTLTVTDGSDLVRASGESPFEPIFDVRSSARGADVSVGMGNGNWVAPRDNARLDVKLDRTVTWDVTIDGGVSQIDADLSNLSLSGVTLKAGVSKGTLTLGAVDSMVAHGGVPVLIDSGVSTFTLRIKEGENVRLRVDKGLSSVNRPSGLSLVDGSEDVYETDGFSENREFWDITLDAGISSVRVEFY